MANVKFTEFPSAATVGSTDIIPIVQGGTNKKATAAVFSTYIGSAFVALTGNQTIAGVKTFSSQLASSVATGTAPFSIASTTKVTNLNADLLDGLSSADFQLALTNPITGTGTTNYLPKFTGASALGNSLVQDNGSSILIGGTLSVNTTSTARTFNVQGLTRLSFNGTDGGYIEGVTTGGTIQGVLSLGVSADFLSSGQVGMYSVSTTDLKFGTNSTLRLTINGTTGAATFASSVTATSVTAPNINVSANNGMYDAGTNSLGFQTNGAARMFVSSAGSVGIGTTSPSSILETIGQVTINAASSGAGIGKLQLKGAKSDGDGFNLSFDNSTNIASINLFYNGALTFGNANTERMRIAPTSGNLLLNTTTDAGYKLDVNGTARVSGNFVLNSAASTITKVFADDNLSFRGYVIGAGIADTTEYAYIKYQPQTGQLVIAGSPSGFGGNIVFKNNETTWLSVNSSNLATFSSSVTATRGIFQGSTGETLTAQGIAGEWTANFRGAASTGNSYGLGVFAGTNSTDVAFGVYNQAITENLFVVKGNGTVNMPNLPTSATGLSAGDIWNDGGTLKIV